MIVLVLLLVATLMYTVFYLRILQVVCIYVLQNTGEPELCTVRLQMKIVLFPYTLYAVAICQNGRMAFNNF